MISLGPQRHATVLERQLQRLGVPLTHGAGREGTAPASLAGACESAIQGEIENIVLYDRLIPMIEDPAARQVMENLQAASRERHLRRSGDAWNANAAAAPDPERRDQGMTSVVASTPVAPVLVSTAVTVTTWAPAFSAEKAPVK